MLDLMRELRQRGYDRQFRAGQSLWRFILSRSRQHGLRPDQPLLIFDLQREGSMFVGYHEPPDLTIEFATERIEIKPQVDGLLKRLLAQPID
ncbi:MAG TPA: hypothetical protein VHD90_26060 [Phototrophicaceae bacterium]|nr:hypothetical protein [Phototrophicaceae bacterium]